MSSIDLEALKAQLKSMGHNLPEHEILAILRDMKINHHGSSSSSADGADSLADNMAGMKLADNMAGAMLAGNEASKPPSHRAALSREDDDAVLTKSVDDDAVASFHPRQPAAWAADVPTRSREERLRDLRHNNPAALLQHQTAAAQQGKGGVRYAPAAAGDFYEGAGLAEEHAYEEDDLDDDARQQDAPKARDQSGRMWAPQQAPRSGAQARRPSADDDAYDGDNDDLRGYDVDLYARGVPRSAKDSNAASRYDSMDELYGARPGSAASVLYGTKTSSVHGGSATGRREVSAGGKKTDRVAAYQAHAKQWKKDTFLKTGAGSKKPLQPRKQSVNFHTLFAALHQHEASAKQRMLKQTREKTHRDLNLGGALQQAATPKRAGSAATMRPASRARSEWVD